jgi:divalent metal cation (Fe/Co/Zn/Cd) transporter
MNKYRKRALTLSYVTVLYNIIEGILSIFAGYLAGSSALIGFALDSFVESLSGIIMIWRFSGNKDGIDNEKEEKMEERAELLVGITFFILGSYVLYEAVEKLIHKSPVEPSLLGIIIAVASIIFMPILFFLKYKTGKIIGSKALVADSKETLACTFLSFVLLFGLLMNSLFSISQADSIAAIIIVIYLFKEGYFSTKEALRNYI